MSCCCSSGGDVGFGCACPPTAKRTLAAAATSITALAFAAVSVRLRWLMRSPVAIRATQGGSFQRLAASSKTPAQ